MAETDARATPLMAHEFNIERMIAGISNDAVARLNALQRELEKLIRVAAPQEPAAARFRRARIKKLEQEIRDLIRQYELESRREVERDVVDLAEEDGEGLAALMIALVSADVLRRSLKRVDIRKLIRDSQFLGLPWRDWHRQHANGVMGRLMQEVRTGVNNRESMASIIARTRQKLNVGIHGVEFMTHTVANGAFNAARMATIELNKARVPAIQVITTFDSQTSDISLKYAGGVWSVSTGLALATSRHRLPFLGPLPWHPNERCRLIPVPVGARPIRVPGVREFLMDQTETFRLQNVGKRKTELLRAGEISPRQLLDFRNRPISLRRMREGGEIAS